MNWTAFSRLVDAEYMTQVEDAGFQAALDGVQLALGVVRGTEPEKTRTLALRFLYRFSNWDDIQLSQEDLDILQKWDNE